MGCPGQDKQNWTFDDIYEEACPYCGIKIDRKELDHRFGRDGPEAMARFRARHGLK